MALLTACSKLPREGNGCRGVASAPAVLFILSLQSCLRGYDVSNARALLLAPKCALTGRIRKRPNWPNRIACQCRDTDHEGGFQSDSLSDVLDPYSVDEIFEAFTSLGCEELPKKSIMSRKKLINYFVNYCNDAGPPPRPLPDALLEARSRIQRRKQNLRAQKEESLKHKPANLLSCDVAHLRAKLNEIGVKGCRSWSRATCVRELTKRRVDARAVWELAKKYFYEGEPTAAQDEAGPRKKDKKKRKLRPEGKKTEKPLPNTPEKVLERALREAWPPEQLSKARAFALLGIAKDSAPEERRRAKTSLVLQWHPDQNADPRASDALRLVMAAAEVVGA